jgi:hypothetical protein
MTKNKAFAILFLLGLCAFFLSRKETSVALKAPVPLSQSEVAAMAPENKNGPVRVETPARSPASLGYVNSPSPDWQDRLEASLKAQGGQNLKTVTIKSEKSFVWDREENPLFVQSVVVTLVNQQEAQSSFRAIVDAQTGKILETWDQTISDPADVRGGFRIKLDPRYTN